jgi:hypothetical protein
MDGFDAGDYALKATAISGGVGTTNSTRFGTGLALTTGSNSSYLRSVPTTTTLIVGFALKQQGLDGSAFFVLYGDNAATNHLSLAYTGVATLTLYRGGTAIASCVSSYPTSWINYYEVLATISDTVGQVIVRINGVEMINFSGDTKNGGTNSYVDTFGFSTGNVGSTHFFDDVYALDTTGTAPYNTFLGDVRVNTLVPNAAGSSTQFTPSIGANYTTVDELPYSATDYVSSTTVGNRDTYALSDLSAAATIFGVQNNVVAKKTDAGNISLKPAIKSGASVYYGSTSSLGNADRTYIDTRALDPSTSTAWTAAGVNALESGFEVA